MHTSLERISYVLLTFSFPLLAFTFYANSSSISLSHCFPYTMSLVADEEYPILLVRTPISRRHPSLELSPAAFSYVLLVFSFPRFVYLALAFCVKSSSISLSHCLPYTMSLATDEEYPILLVRTPISRRHPSLELSPAAISYVLFMFSFPLLLLALTFCLNSSSISCIIVSLILFPLHSAFSNRGEDTRRSPS